MTARFSGDVVAGFPQMDEIRFSQFKDLGLFFDHGFRLCTGASSGAIDKRGDTRKIERREHLHNLVSHRLPAMKGSRKF